MANEQEHHACSRFLIFSETRQFSCKIIQTWTCNTLNSGYHLSRSTAGQQQKTRCRYRKGQHSYSLVLLRHRGSTARAYSLAGLQRPISSNLNHFRNLADKTATFPTQRDKLAAVCAFSLEACHSVSVSARTTLTELMKVYFHL